MDEVNEMEALNFCHSCFFSESNAGQGNLESLGYKPSLKNLKFGLKSPDLTYFLPDDSKKELFALMIDVKSGHVEEEHLARQAASYSRLDLLQVNDSFRKHARNHMPLSEYTSYKVARFSVAFQYYDNILSDANEEERRFLEELKKHVHMLSCKKGDRVQSWGGIPIKDDSTAKLYQSGIRIPKVAADIKIMCERPGEEFVAFIIARHAMESCFLLEQPEFTSNELKNDVFFTSNVTISRIETVLTKMNKLRLCVKKQMGTANPVAEEQIFAFPDAALLAQKLIPQLYEGKTLDDMIKSRKFHFDES